MKKWCVTILAMFGFTLMSVSAQSDFAPNALFTLSDFGLNVPVPSNWTYSVGDAYYFAADDGAINAASDNDPNSSPASPVLVIQAINLSDLGVADNTPLDSVFPLMADVLSVQANNEVSESGVAGKRVVSAFGQVGAGGAILSVWLQDQRAMALLLLTPDAQTVSDYSSAYELTLNNIGMSDSEDLDEQIGSSFRFTIDYPRGWTPLNLEQQGLFGLFERDDDAQNVANGNGDTLEGVVFSVTVRSYEELRLTNRATLRDVLTLLGNSMADKNIVYEGDFYVNELSGTGVSGITQNGRYQTLVATLDNDNQSLTLYALSARDEDELRKFMPTFLMMLQSITADI